MSGAATLPEFRLGKGIGKLNRINHHILALGYQIAFAQDNYFQYMFGILYAVFVIQQLLGTGLRIPAVYQR